jgi:hypothetical protein
MTKNGQQNPSRKELLFSLADIAAHWRETQSARYIKEYHDTYHQLRALGWTGTLDLEAELPDEYMPKDYVERSSISQAASD